MSQSHFYALPDEAAAIALAPTIYQTDDLTGEVTLKSPLMLYSRAGIRLTADELGEQDPETGEQEVITPGDRSAPYVILSPVHLEILEDYCVPEHPFDGGFS